LMKHSLYGFMQSGRNWAEHLNESLGVLEWVRSCADPAIHIHTADVGTSIVRVLSGEPLLFRPFRLSLRLPLRLPARLLLRPPLRLMPLTFRPPVLVGTCCATKPVIIVDTSGHVLLGSY
jgi:hypothetical protein